MYNNRITGFIPMVDGDGVKHTVEVSVLVDLDNGEFVLTAALDGELFTGMTCTEDHGIYTLKIGIQ